MPTRALKRPPFTELSPIRTMSESTTSTSESAHADAVSKPTENSLKISVVKV